MTRYFEEECLEFRSSGGGPVPLGRSVFLCYAREDRKWIDRFKTIFHPYVRQARLITWDDGEISVGDDWHNRIQERVKAAKAVVLFISRDFLASDYLATSELPAFLWKRRTDDRVRIFPILVSPSLWDDAEFRYPDPSNGPHSLKLSTLQAVNREERTLVEMPEPEQDRVLISVAKGISTVLGDA